MRRGLFAVVVGLLLWAGAAQAFTVKPPLCFRMEPFVDTVRLRVWQEGAQAFRFFIAAWIGAAEGEVFYTLDGGGLSAGHRAGVQAALSHDHPVAFGGNPVCRLDAALSFNATTLTGPWSLICNGRRDAEPFQVEGTFAQISCDAPPDAGLVQALQAQGGMLAGFR